MKHSLNIISSFALLIQNFLDENTGLPDGEKQHDTTPTGKFGSGSQATGQRWLYMMERIQEAPKGRE